jgi:hypothetical protein
MAHSAVDKKQEKYGAYNFMIRSRLFKGLNTGTMNMRTIFDDKKIEELKDMELPFRIDLLPINFPNPNELILSYAKQLRSKYFEDIEIAKKTKT